MTNVYNARDFRTRGGLKPRNQSVGERGRLRGERICDKEINGPKDYALEL